MKNNYRIEGDVVYIEIVRNDNTVLETLIDLEDLELVSSYPSWQACYEPRVQGYYIQCSYHHGKYQTVKLHRVIMQLVEPQLQVDHIYHSTLDNRKSQLRIVTNQENQFNRKEVKGYSWNKQLSKWQAYISVNSRRLHLGFFTEEEVAKNAYLVAKSKYHVIGGIQNATQ